MDSSGDAETGGGAELKHFEMVPEATDHHHLSYNNGSNQCFSDITSPVYLKIMKEWKILKTSLPESIYVQVYETRIDLLRAVIIGPAGTPYHDGLFFFDIVLPADYPQNPPKVYYHSHGYRLNPNLYESGYLCLSLVNTWDGSEEEIWSTKSTILQLLVSIQGLVLNERPYFNEPGYEVGATSTEASWVNAAVDYNEDAFVLSCKTMLRTIRKPPMNFEDFIVGHFRGRRASVLAAIDQYEQGNVAVGKFQVDAAAAPVRVSAKFKAELAEIRGLLSKAFDEMDEGGSKSVVAKEGRKRRSYEKGESSKVKS